MDPALPSVIRCMLWMILGVSLSHPADLQIMFRNLKLAEGKLGLERRISKCKRPEVKRKHQAAAPADPEYTELSAMAILPTSETMRVLGAPANMTSDHGIEFEDILAKARQACYGAATGTWAPSCVSCTHPSLRVLRGPVARASEQQRSCGGRRHLKSR